VSAERDIYSHSNDKPVPWLPDPIRHDMAADEFLPSVWLAACRHVLANKIWASATLTDTTGRTTEYRFLTEDEAAEWAVEIATAKEAAEHG
jgi:hypothetical protein